MRTKTAIYALLDILCVAVVFSFFLLIKTEPFIQALGKYLNSFLLFLALWLVISFISNKYSLHLETDLWYILRRIIFSNIAVMGVATTIMFLVRIDYYSRLVVFGTIALASLLELVSATLSYYIRTAIPEPVEVDASKTKGRRQRLKKVFQQRKTFLEKKIINARENAILVEINQEAYHYIFSIANIESPDTLIISTTSHFNIDTQLKDTFDSIVNLKRTNDIRYINKFFESANAKLAVGGLFIDFVETKDLRKKRILKKYIFPINYLAYFLDFIIKRLFPRFKLTKGFYFFLTRGQNRVFTKAETFGRLYSCGFEVIDEKLINKHLYFVARKISEPLFPESPTYGPFVKLERVGFKGKTFKLLKLRTMHPYAEYIQEYVYEKEGLESGGKFKSDFRISTLGKFLRMFWLDELPSLMNCIKGDLKIVGIRPLSKHYFSLYSKEMQKRRINYKPGLIPPYYVHKPETLEEIMESEKRYMDEYDRHPWRTDTRYFFKAIWNIIFKRYRSG